MESLKEAVLRFEEMSFDTDEIRKNAERFSEDIFEESFRAFINEKVNNE